jgi:hypothetical protein
MNKEYKTTSFYLAAFLLCRGITLTQVKRKGLSKQATFVFQDTPKREHYTNDFLLNQNTMVDAPLLIKQIKKLKSIIHDG